MLMFWQRDIRQTKMKEWGHRQDSGRAREREIEGERKREKKRKNETFPGGKGKERKL